MGLVGSILTIVREREDVTADLSGVFVLYVVHEGCFLPLNFLELNLRLLSEENVYPRLSGSAQSYLYSILESLVNYGTLTPSVVVVVVYFIVLVLVIRTEDNHSSLVVCINDIIYNHKQSKLSHKQTNKQTNKHFILLFSIVCKNSYNDHCKKQSQIQLKKIERQKATLMHYIENKYTREISCHVFSLPDDCLRQIIVLVQVPADVFNLGRTCRYVYNAMETLKDIHGKDRPN